MSPAAFLCVRVRHPVEATTSGVSIRTIQPSLLHTDSVQVKGLPLPNRETKYKFSGLRVDL